MSGGGTPRQQMIGMMYLVLLAMLAMNASKDLLNAFVFLDNGINETVKSFNQANSAFYNTIDKAAVGSADYKPVQKQANEIKAKAEEVVQMMSNHKVWLFSTGMFTTTADTAGSEEYRALFENGIPLNKDNQDIGGGFYVPGGIESPDAIALKEGVDSFRDLVIKVLNSDGDPDNDYLVGKYTTLFNTEKGPNPLEPGGPEVSWASKLSEHIPLAAVTANLTLWQSYIKNAEADVIGSIASKMDGSGMVVDESKGVVQFDNGYVLKNDTVKASMFLAAYNSKAKPKIYIGVVDTTKFKGDQYKVGPGIASKPPLIGEYRTLENIKNGSGSYTTMANEVGAQTITGVIENKSSKGTFYTKFKSSYMVAEPSATVAATKMSVFYVGVSNPVSVSAPGVAISDIEISAPGLVFKADKKAGTYTVSPRKATNKKGVDVVVKNKKSKAILGKANFRVKRLPDPSASVLNKKEGLIKRGLLKAISRVDAKMENFDFDLSVTVQQFTLTVKVGSDLMSFKSKNNTLTPAMKNILKKVKRGSRVYFEDIKVQMPGGSRPVPSLIFKVQ